MQAKTTSEFYKFAVDVVFAFIVGQSFIQLALVISPVDRTDFGNFDFGILAGVVLVYFIIITGWVGYHKSIIADPHEGFLGTIRFGIDLVITFVVYYLLLLSDPLNKTKFGLIFIYLIPVLYTIYVFWDMIKFFEHRKKFPDFRGPVSRFLITVGFGLISVTVGIFYVYFLDTSSYPLLNSNRVSIDIWFIFLYFAHTTVYRYFKRSKQLTINL